MNATYASRIAVRLREFGPYFLVALLPGGLFLASLMWLQQRFQKTAISNETVPATGSDDGNVASCCSPLNGDLT